MSEELPDFTYEPEPSDTGSARRRGLLLGVAALIGGLILLVATEWASLRRSSSSGHPTSPAHGTSTALASLESGDTASPHPAVPGITGGPTAVRAFGASPIPPPEPEGPRSPLANRLNAPDGSAEADVAIVGEIVTSYYGAFHRLPVGTSAEIVAALAGDNPRGLAPLPSDHPAIAPTGELLDRWGSPFFFHQVSREIMEVRSAGPDHRHFTDDDIVWPKPVDTAVPTAFVQSTN